MGKTVERTFFFRTYECYMYAQIAFNNENKRKD